jgi:hypothetical protein
MHNISLGKVIFLFCKTPRPTLRPKEPLMKSVKCSFPGIKRPGREVKYPPSSSDEVKNEWNHNSTIPIGLSRLNRYSIILSLYRCGENHAQTSWGGSGNQKKIYFWGTICRRCVLAALRTVNVGLTKAGNQTKSLTYPPPKIVFHTNLERMFKRTATGLHVQLTTMQLWLMRAYKNARLLPDCCCCLNDKGNEILFTINIPPPLTTIAGLDGAGQRLGLPGHRTSHQWTSSYEATLKPWFTSRQLILKGLSFPFKLRRYRLCI